MPMSRRTLATPGQGYGRPFRGEVAHTAQILVNITALTSAEVDADGFIKPGVPLRKNGGLVSAGGQAIFGVVPEPIKVADGNTGPLLAAASAAYQLAIGTIGQVNRAIIEDNLGRSLTADELAAFLAADCRVILLL